MALLNRGLGAPSLLSIGRKGERPDWVPALLASAPQIVISPTGRPVEMATFITAQQNRAGETFLGERVHNLAYAMDRSQRIELLDGTEDSPKSLAQIVAQKAADSKAFFDARQSADLVEITEPEA